MTLGRELDRALGRKRRSLALRRAKRFVEGLVYRGIGLAVSPWLARRTPRLPPQRVLLVLRAQRLGDAVVSLAFSAAVRAAFPQASIWATGPPALEKVLQCDAHLDGFRPLPHPDWRQPARAFATWRDLRAMSFDLAFVLGIHFPSTALGRFASRCAVGYDYNHRGFLLDCPLIPHISCNRSGFEYGPETHPPHITAFWGRLLTSLTGTEVTVSWRGLDLGRHRRGAQVFLADMPPGPLLVFHPFAGNPMRSWPLPLSRQFVDLVLERTNWRIVVTGGPKDQDAACSLGATANPRLAVAAGRLEVMETWALLPEAGVLVGVDTAVVHMAAAVGAPVVSLFGAGDPLVWGPYGQDAGILQANQWCQRCKRSRCLHPGLPCMTALDPERVLQAASQLMRSV